MSAGRFRSVPIGGAGEEEAWGGSGGDGEIGLENPKLTPTKGEGPAPPLSGDGVLPPRFISICC